MKEELNQLNKEKTLLEIQELKLVWWKKPEYLRVFLPTFIAIISVIFAISSGLIDVKKERLELQKERLQDEIKDFELKRDAIVIENKQLSEKNGQLKDSLFFVLEKQSDLVLELQTRLKEIKIEKNKRKLAEKEIEKTNQRIFQYEQKLSTSENKLKTYLQSEIKRIEKDKEDITEQINTKVENSVTISGKIIDDVTQKVVSNARIIISDRYGKSFKYETTSGSDGRFALIIPRNLNTGRVNVDVLTQSYAKNSRSIWSGGNRDLDIRLWK